MIDHAFEKSTNPRYSGCLHCGRLPEYHMQASTRRRDVDEEREITREAGRGLVDPAALIEFSEARAGGTLVGEYVVDPGVVRLGKDWLRNLKEEIADGRNYAIWFIQEQPGTEKAHDTFLALRHLLLAYDLLCRES